MPCISKEEFSLTVTLAKPQTLTLITIDKQQVSFVLLFNKRTPKMATGKASFLRALFLEKQANTRKNKRRAVFNTRKQTRMRSLDCFGYIHF